MLHYILRENGICDIYIAAAAASGVMGQWAMSDCYAQSTDGINLESLLWHDEDEEQQLWDVRDFR